MAKPKRLCLFFLIELKFSSIHLIFLLTFLNLPMFRINLTKYINGTNAEADSKKDEQKKGCKRLKAGV